MHWFPVYALIRGNVAAKLVDEGGEKTALAIKLCYWILPVLWLKFLLIWRFFRFWSLLMGVDCIENMPDCYNNVNSLMMFWRKWHQSFNRWLLRYLYIPFGGSKNKQFSV